MSEPVDQALGPTGRSYEFITALGEMHGETPRYVFLVEFDEPVSDEEGRRMLDGVEGALRSQNDEYANKRDSMRLGPPALRLITPGEFDRYRTRSVQSGAKRDSQFKIMRLTMDQAFADEFTFDREIVATTGDRGETS